MGEDASIGDFRDSTADEDASDPNPDDPDGPVDSGRPGTSGDSIDRPAADGAPSDDRADAEETEGTDVETVADGPPDVAPTVSTYRWSPEGGVCEDCGEMARRQWRDDEAMVCSDCKEW